MWIDAPRARRSRNKRPHTRRMTGPPVLSLVMLVGCGEGSDGGGSEAVPPEGPSSAEAASFATAASAQPETVGDLFPEGEGRDLVLNNCSSCHAVACSVIGQRTTARWNGLREGHADRLPALPEGELEVIFSYLMGHFNDTRPEPTVPATFLAAGCTPF